MIAGDTLTAREAEYVEQLEQLRDLVVVTVTRLQISGLPAIGRKLDLCEAARFSAMLGGPRPRTEEDAS